ncbi:MAG TPA: DsbA family oxidoreductase [Actinomycetota bacterium]|nr:DsbA family oxidoreductase [Actinomycetota bacterium]
MIVEIWGDIVCPWCYIGERRFRRALGQAPYAGEVVIRHRSFQLDPSAPAVASMPIVEMLAEKYGVSVAEAERFERQAADAAAGEGLPFHTDRIRANTFDAHRLVHLASRTGREAELMDGLYAAYFARGLAISDRDTLVALAEEAGVDPAEATRVLGSDAYAAEVIADQRQAYSLGASAVPFFVIDRRYGIRGAQPIEAFEQTLQRAWEEARPSPAPPEPSASPAGR